MLTRTLAVILLLFTATAQAQIEINWWHSMSGALGDKVNQLASDFNASQKAYKVLPVYKGSYPESMTAAIAAFRAGNAPHILQVFEVGTATMMSAKGAIKPVYLMMKEAGEKFDPQAYLSAITGYYSTAKGEMLSFPFNSSSTVMWYNKDAFKKAGLDPDQPPKTWPEVFEAAKKLKAAGHATCGFSNAWVTWVNLEQLSSWHNVPLATKANGALLAATTPGGRACPPARRWRRSRRWRRKRSPRTSVSTGAGPRCRRRSPAARRSSRWRPAPSWRSSSSRRSTSAGACRCR